jgi:VWFA-related protein
MGALRGAALSLIDDVRPGDSVAVFRFDNQASTLLDFTNDKDAARRSVLHTYAQGGTALYDALVYANRSFAGRVGKKAIIVFTDGEDSASGLSSEAAVTRARIAGIPIYTIAHGFAINTTAQSSALRTELAAISRATGGNSYMVNDDSRLAEIFSAISRDLTRGYLLTFKPTAPAGTWHELKVKVKDPLKDPEIRTVRARLGYYPD